MNHKLLAVCVAASILCLVASGVEASLLDERYSTPDFTTPDNIGDHVFNFFHHSCGSNLLGHGLSTAMTNLGYTLHSRIGNTYVYENNYTDYRHWYKRFQRELGIESGGTYYVFTGPDVNGDPTVGDPIPSDEFMLTWYEYNAEAMDIIMFKPCYPGAALTSYDCTYDGSPGNNGYGNVTAGTPYSDSAGASTNFDYLNSSSSVSSSYADTYWPGHGYWNSSGATLAQLKTAYRGMLNIFLEHPDLLFIAMQAPPMLTDNMTTENAASCREFARWMREDWLHQFDPTGTDQFQDYPLPNVVPFDFHNSIAWTENDAILDADYFWFVQGGFPDDSMDTTNPALVGTSAKGLSGDNHPASWQNQRVSVIFCGGEDTFSPPETGNTGRTYDEWINAVVNLWEGGMGPTPTAGPSVPATGTPGILFLLTALGGLLAIGLLRR